MVMIIDRFIKKSKFIIIILNTFYDNIILTMCCEAKDRYISVI